MQAFWLALQFLTRLPTPGSLQFPPEAVGRSLLFYPLVGLIIGGLLYATVQLTAHISPLPAAALVVTLWLWLSGALHIDGLADMADGWVGGHGDRERTLAIMKDPYCGPMGLAAVVAVLLLKFSALVVLIPSPQSLLLIVAPLFGRGFAVLLMLTTPYCRESGLASDMVNFLPKPAAWGVFLLWIVIVIWWLKWQVAWPLLTALAVFLLYRRALVQRLHGFSGDGAGALIEIIEVVILLIGTVTI